MLIFSSSHINNFGVILKLLVDFRIIFNFNSKISNYKIDQ